MILSDCLKYYVTMEAYFLFQLKTVERPKIVRSYIKLFQFAISGTSISFGIQLLLLKLEGYPNIIRKRVQPITPLVIRLNVFSGYSRNEPLNKIGRSHKSNIDTRRRNISFLKSLLLFTSGNDPYCFNLFR